MDLSLDESTVSWLESLDVAPKTAWKLIDDESTAALAAVECVMVDDGGCWVVGGKIDEKDGSTLSYTEAVLHLLTVGLATNEVVALDAITVQVVGLVAVFVEVVVFVVVDKVIRHVLVVVLLLCVVGVVCKVGDGELAKVVVFELGWFVGLMRLIALGLLVVDNLSTVPPPPGLPCTSNKCG